MSQTRATQQGEHSKLEAGTQRRRRSNVFASHDRLHEFLYCGNCCIKKNVKRTRPTLELD